MQDRLREDVTEEKGRHCLQYHQRAVFIEVSLSCQNCTQSHHPHRISSLNFPTALIWADAVLTVWFLGLPSITEYIKMPEGPFARGLQQLRSQERGSPLITLMQFFFFNGDVARGPEEES